METQVYQLTPDQYMEFCDLEFKNLNEFSKNRFDFLKESPYKNSEDYKLNTRLRKPFLFKTIIMFDLTITLELRSFKLIVTKKYDPQYKKEYYFNLELLNFIYQLPVDQIDELFVKSVPEDENQNELILTKDDLVDFQLHQELRMNDWPSSSELVIDRPGSTSLLRIEYPKIIFTAKEAPSKELIYSLSRQEIQELIKSNYQNYPKLLEKINYDHFAKNKDENSVDPFYLEEHENEDYEMSFVERENQKNKIRKILTQYDMLLLPSEEKYEERLNEISSVNKIWKIPKQKLFICASFKSSRIELKPIDTNEKIEPYNFSFHELFNLAFQIGYNKITTILTSIIKLYQGTNDRKKIYVEFDPNEEKEVSTDFKVIEIHLGNGLLTTFTNWGNIDINGKKYKIKYWAPRIEIFDPCTRLLKTVEIGLDRMNEIIQHKFEFILHFQTKE